MASQSVELTLPITGMHCANCAVTIERVVGRLEGVGKVSVNLAHEEALITYDPARAKGRRMPFSVLHELDRDGLPDAMTITWATIMFHRAAAKDVVSAVGKRAAPSHAPQPVSYAARLYPENQNSPPLHVAHTDIKIADLRHAAEREHAEHLVDILFRRTGIGWATPIPSDAVERAARSVADILGWNESRVAEEIARYRAYVERYHLQS